MATYAPGSYSIHVTAEGPGGEVGSDSGTLNVFNGAEVFPATEVYQFQNNIEAVYLVGEAAETDTALPIGYDINIPLGVAEEVDNSLAMSSPRRITEKLLNTNYESLDPIISLVEVPIAIEEQTKIVQHQSRNPTVTLIPTVTPLQVTSKAVNVQYRAIRDRVLLIPEPIGITTTLCFHGELAGFEFDGIYGEPVFNGTIRTTC